MHIYINNWNNLNYNFEMQTLKKQNNKNST